MARLLLGLLLLLSTALPTIAFAEASPEGQVLDLVNAERARTGLPALRLSPQLTASAEAYALTMAEGSFVAHVGPDGSTLVTRNEAAGYANWTFLEENLAAGFATPEAVVAAWMNSPSHREALLSPRVYETGVGYVYRAGSAHGHYWAQEFGARNEPTRKLSFQASSLPTARPPEPTGAPSPSAWVSPVTGYAIQGEWLAFFRSSGGLDALGQPRSGVVVDPSTGQRIQYFQRAVLEWHPEGPAGHRIQRRLLGDILYPGVDLPLPPDAAPTGLAAYFPCSPDRPTGLGHFVADCTATGQPIYFKEFFDAHGGVQAFGYPKEEPKLRNGQWTQRFQAAVFEYHPEDDVDGFLPGSGIPHRTYRVQLRLLGDEYLDQQARQQVLGATAWNGEHRSVTRPVAV